MFLGSDGPFCFTGIYKFGSFSHPFAMITSMSELRFRFRRFIVLVQTKKVISLKYGSSTSSWKSWRWVRSDLMLSLRDIYINSNLKPRKQFPTSSRSTEFRDILPCNISQMITKTIPITTRIVISNAMKWGIPLWIWWKENGNWDSSMIRISQWREGLFRTNTSIRRNKSKSAKLWESQSGIRAEKLTIWARSLEIITEFTRSINSTRIGKPVLMMDVKVSPRQKH